MSINFTRAIRRNSWGLAVAVFLGTSAASALQGGNPTDPYSCYSDCGDLVTPGVQNCFCDALCESKGDCCVDKHEWCAPSTAKPVCSMIDDTKATSKVCGTDLGYSFVHNGRIEMLFGDTWEYNAIGDAKCVDHGADGRSTTPPDYNDDSQAKLGLNISRPTWAPTQATGYVTGADRTCQSLAGATTVLDFDRTPTSGSPYTFQQIRLKRSSDGLDIPMGLVNTPLTGFSDGFNAFGMFVAAPPDEAFPYQVNKHVYVARRHGEGSTIDRTQYDTIADLGRYHAAGGTTAFLNVSSARVTSLTNFTTPTGPAASQLLVWGRPSFSLGDGTATSTNALYLMKVAISASGLTTWSPSYFNGPDASGQATWTSTAPGVAMLATDFHVGNQFDVKWISELGKWVLLYGGDLADYFSPPNVSDQPRHGAIHMRTADYPWGPWSRPTPLLWREEMGRYYQCDAYDNTTPQGCDRKTFPPPTYPPGDWEPLLNGFTGTSPFQDAACQFFHPRAAQTPNLNPLSPFCPLLSQRGNLYAPNLLPTWTRSTDPPLGATGSTTIYFTVSTWYPYDVVLAAADLATPRVTYPLQMQLRQVTSNKMIGGTGTTPAFSTTAGGSNGGLVAFRVDKDGSTGGDKMKVGDNVVLHHVNDSNRFLAVVGSALSYITNAATVPSNAKWTITSSTLPGGTLVVPGSTQVLLTSVSSPTLVIKSTGSPAQPTVGAADTTSSFRFGYFCQAGDTCAR